MLHLAIAGFLILCATVFGLATWKYRCPFHPLLLPGLNLLVMAAFAPLAQQAAEHTSTGLTGPRVAASLLSSLYLLGLALPLLLNFDPLLPLLRTLFRPCEVRWRPEYRGIYLICAAGLFAGFVAGYALLLRDSSAGRDWLTDPRGAYRVGREGVGHWYVLSQTCLFLALLVLLYFQRWRNPLAIAAATLAAGGLFVLFGSKAGILGILIAAGLYYNFYVRRIPPLLFAAGAALLVPAALLSPLLQGNFDSLRESLAYYDYFDNSAAFLAKADRFGPLYGEAALSELWTYVPRRFYPDKPFIYGQLFINDYFWPGAAEQGHTPALLPWTIYYLDGGAAGVFLAAVAIGFGTKAVYSYFLQTRSFMAFLLLLQVCFVPVVKHVPFAYFLAMLIVLAAGMSARLRLCSTSPPFASSVA